MMLFTGTFQDTASTFPLRTTKRALRANELRRHVTYYPRNTNDMIIASLTSVPTSDSGGVAPIYLAL